MYREKDRDKRHGTVHGHTLATSTSEGRAEYPQDVDSSNFEATCWVVIRPSVGEVHGQG